MKRSVFAKTILILAACLPSFVFASPVIDSINAGLTSASVGWAVTEVGWFYTPGFGYELEGIFTKFGTSKMSSGNYNRTVTAEVYDEHPGSGGVLLRSIGFVPIINTFAGGHFAGLSLTSGEDYFIGFRNVGGLDANITSDSGAINLGSLRFSFSNDGSYSGTDTMFPVAQPILQFHGTPEPSTYLLFAIGILGILGLSYRQRKKAA